MSSLYTLQRMPALRGDVAQVGIAVGTTLASVALLMLLAAMQQPPANAGAPAATAAAAPSRTPALQTAALTTILTDEKVAPGARPAEAAYRLSSVAAPFLFSGNDTVREYSVSCLAAAAWYEAGNDATSQRSVMQVVLNRLRHPSFPKTVCGVVFQGSERKTGCQFTFTCDGSLARRFPSENDWGAARVRAQAALDGQVDPDVANATHYHADYVSPWWSSHLVRLATVGRHIFYRFGEGRAQLSARPGGGAESDRAFVDRFASEAPNHLPRGRSRTEAAPPTELAVVPPSDTAPTGIATRPSLLATQSAVGSFHVTQVDNVALPGRWAASALTTCAGARGCSVAAYSLDGTAPGQTAPPDAGVRPLFLFVRDPTSGMEIALWDCEKVARTNRAQCLPANNTELARLMRINRN